MNEIVDDVEFRWAERVAESLAEGEDPPDPPQTVIDRVEERRRARKALRCRERAVEEGLIENVPHDERCIGIAHCCMFCGQELADPGDPYQRCPER